MSGKGTMRLEACRILFDREREAGEEQWKGVRACHYPAAWEDDGKLYIIATKSYQEGSRGAVLFIVPLSESFA